MKKQTKKQILEKLKPNQETILILIYKFRYLNSRQIQILLNQKYKENVRIWLNELTANKYIFRFYNPKFAGDPAIFCLDIKGRKYFMEHPELKDIKVLQLSRVYKEKKLSSTFRKKCLFAVDIYLSLLSLTKKNNATLHYYSKSDLYGIESLISPNPEAYFSIVETDNSSKRYFLDIFDELSQPRDIRRRVREYTNYFSSGDWQSNNKNPFPIILFVCFDNRLKNYLKYHIKKMPVFNEGDLQFYLSTREEIQKFGVCRQVLHKVI